MRAFMFIMFHSLGGFMYQYFKAEPNWIDFAHTVFVVVMTIVTYEFWMHVFWRTENETL